MATYITLFNWTDQGVRNVKDSPNRIRQAEGHFQQLGVTLTSIYCTMGDYDLVGVLEAPDDQALARALLALGMGETSGPRRSRHFRARSSSRSSAGWASWASSAVPPGHARRPPGLPGGRCCVRGMAPA